MLQNIVFEELLFFSVPYLKEGMWLQSSVNEWRQSFLSVLCLSDFNIFLRMDFKLQLLR